jgi:hypothetical protein
VAWSYHKPRWVFIISRPWWNRKAGYRRSSPVCHPLLSYADGDVFEQPLIPRALSINTTTHDIAGVGPADDTPRRTLSRWRTARRDLCRAPRLEGR